MSTRWTTRLVASAFGAALLLGVVTAPAADAVTTDSVQIDPASQFQTIQSWGTSLAWWAEGTGGWSSTSAKNALADALFANNNGIGLNAVRYDIGAGTPGDTCASQLRLGAGIPAYERSPGAYDWTVDPNQRWMLQAAKSRGANVFEAVAYSAPAYMTLNDCSAGADTAGADNLGSDEYPAYAQYLATVVQHFHDDFGVTFSSIAPFNEAVQSQWSSAGKQQAMNLGTAGQQAVVSDLQSDLAANGMTGYTGVSTADELGVSGSVSEYNALPAAEQAGLVQVNTHDYRAQDGSPLYQLGVRTGKPVSMSEWGANGESTQIGSALDLSQHILTNEQQMHPQSWYFWQGVDGGANNGTSNDLWGLAYADISSSGNGTLTFPKRYYVMGNYSKFVRPGYRMVDNSDPNSFTAYDPSSQTAVIVATNPTTSAEQVDYDLSGFTTVGGAATPYQTDASENLAALSTVSLTGNHLSVSLPAQSVTTYVIPGTTFTGSSDASGVTPYGSQTQVFARDSSGAVYSNVRSGVSWSGWRGMGGDLADSPVATQYGTQLEVFGRGPGGATEQDVYTEGGGWSGWQSMGGTIASDPAVVQYGSQLQVFGTTSTGTTFSDVYTPGSGWSGWQSLGGTITRDPVAVVFGQQMEVFGRASGGGVWTDVYTPGSGWSGWHGLGGQLAGDLTAVQYDGQVELFGRDAAGTVQTDTSTLGRGWSGWQSLGGAVVGTVSVSQYGSQLQVYGRAADGSTRSIVQTPGSGWSGWQDIGGVIVTDPVGIRSGQSFEVFGEAAGGTMWTDVYTPGSGWSGWQSLAAP